MNTRFKYLISILFLFISVGVSAQNISLKWEEDATIDFYFYKGVRLSNGQIVTKKLSEKHNLDLLLLSPELDILKENATDLDNKEIRFDEGRFWKLGSNIFYINEEYNKKDKETTISALKINPLDLSVGPKIILGTFYSDSYDLKSVAKYIFSPDSTKFLISVISPQREKGNASISIGVFNTDLRAIWKKNVIMDGSKNKVAIDPPVVFNSGDVYLTSKLFDKALSVKTIREKQNKISPYTYSAEIYSASGSKTLKFPIGDKNIQASQLFYNVDGSAIVGGLYKNIYNGNISGFFYGDLEKGSTEVKNINFKEIPLKIISASAANEFANDTDPDKGLAPYFKSTEIIKRSNSSVDFIFEYQKLTLEKTPFDYYAEDVFESYDYGDIIDINISGSGVTFTRIPTFFRGNSSSRGHFVFENGNDLIFLYNDHRENLDISVNEKTLRLNPDKKGLVAGIINNKGLTRKMIFENQGGKTLIIVIPTLIKKISATNYEIPADFLKKGTLQHLKFGVLEVK